MLKATKEDKALVIKILTDSFSENQSVNYIVKQDTRREDRIKFLMDYSFDICLTFGEVLLSNDKKGCALVLYPDLKKFTLQSVILDIKLLLKSISLSNASKAMSREKAIKSNYPQKPFYYLWFLGVSPDQQNRGIGTKLLTEIIQESIARNRAIYLETSSIKNLPWYKKFGFSIFKELSFGYKLYMLKRG